MEIGDSVRKLRMWREMTQKELAQRIGMSANALCAIELNRAFPAKETIVKICRVLNVPVGYLLFFALTEEDLKLFSNREGLELEVEQDTVASVWRVIEGGTGDLGVVVLFRRVGFDSIAHESDHIANCIFDDLGIDLGYTHDEHHAYMIGWVAKCIAEGLGLKIVKEEKK